MSVPIPLLLERYPALADVPLDRLRADLENVVEVVAPARSTLFHELQPCGGFPLVIDGVVRVARGSPDGRELELYRVHAGEICVVSTGCLLGSTPMSAHGIALTDTRLLLVERPTLLAWTAFPAVRLFLLGLMAGRMAELMGLIEAVAFRRLDQRLARSLLGHGRVIRCTHQHLADELGTAREMVSRLLKRFEEQGLLRLGREQIELLDLEQLRSIAAPA